LDPNRTSTRQITMDVALAGLAAALGVVVPRDGGVLVLQLRLVRRRARGR
jgi:hypothetical protein